MTCNVRGLDRGVRAILGVAFILAALFTPLDTVWRMALFMLAGVALLTALVRYCPLNTLIGLNTCWS